ncbi:TetR/AcrR family transcriptional regulator [Antricoccus suffuscus]|nr:TetR/AcrR family transcriptional regulator [Antricoccus suffuscus]
MARPRADDVRDRVVLETFAQIADRGVDGMSMRTLAAATGLSVGTITYHFTNKRRLLLEAITYGYQRRPSGFQDGDAVRSLQALLHRYDLGTEKRRTWWQFWLAVVTYAQKDDEIRSLLTAQHHSAVGRFRDLIFEGITSGELQDVDVPATAERLVAQAHGLAIAQLVDPSADEILRRGLPALLDPIRRKDEDRTPT